MTPRHRTRALLVALLGMALVLAAPGSAAAHGPYCGQVWGSLPERAGSPQPGAALTGVRTGRHACFDRLVLDARGTIGGFDVRYVRTVTEQGRGHAVPLRGGADLQIRALAPAYDTSGDPTWVPADRSEAASVTGYRTFRQVAWVSSFEGSTVVGLGVRARLPFRVFVLPGPGDGSRLVVDVAHRW